MRAAPYWPRLLVRGLLALSMGIPAVGLAAVPSTMVLAPGNFIHVVADLQRSSRFYSDVLGLQPLRFSRDAPRFAPNPAVARLYAIPEQTPIGVAVFRLPTDGVALEFAEFRIQGLPRRPVHLAPQDPGASVLVLEVRDLQPIVRRAQAAGARILTPGGRPVLSGSGLRRQRALVLRDPDGYYVELLEADEATDSNAGDTVLRAGLMLPVADTAQTVHFYRDLLGIPLHTDTAFAVDEPLSRAFGSAPAPVRHTIARIGTSPFTLDFVQWQAVAHAQLAARVADPGVTVLRLVVDHVDAVAGGLSRHGVPVLSAGARCVALTSAFHACIVADPNGLFVEPVSPRPPRRPPP